MPDVVRIQNVIYSWTSTRILIDAQPFKGIVAIDYEEKRERKIVYAAKQNGAPLGWTSGKYSVPSFTVKFLRDSFNALTDYLSIKGLGAYGDAEFQIMVQTVEPVVGAFPITRVFDPCTIIGVKEANDEGIDELVTEVELACLQATINGKQLFSAIRSIGI